MSSVSPLDELCVRCGIATQYVDIWAKERRPSDTVKIALLNAMGVAITAAEEAEDRVARLDEAQWRQTLPPVKVVHEGTAPWELPLVVPEGHASLAWFFDSESGEHTGGDIEPESMPAPERRECAGASQLRYSWRAPTPAAPGYHWLGVSLRDRPGQTLARTRLIVCPASCHAPPELEEGARLWGPALQLYALRSARNWGMGDFGDLRAAIGLAASSAAGFVGLNPLHALDVQQPHQASPYSPSSRTAFNVLYIDVQAMPDFEECQAARRLVASPEFQATLAALREAELVDYTGVARVKFQVLEALYAHFREHHLARGSLRAGAFRAFQDALGQEGSLQALFEALHEHFRKTDSSMWGWPVWPEPYRDARSEAVATFHRLHAERVEYYQYLQWQADLQLGAARSLAHASGLPIGLYQDIPVGANPGGAETWSHPGLHAHNAHIGAPPDEFNLKGQDWGLAPIVPAALVRALYQPFIAVLRFAMRHAGALRIDHVMGLMRLFWVPRDAQADEGTYVSYPFEDLLGILALESRRNACLVIGEDLGTVPDEVRSAMARLRILSYRPLYFERAGSGAFKPPEDYPRDALATVSTHDLPTLEGFWRGADLSARQALELFPDEHTRVRMLMERAEDRVRLLLALEQAGLEPAAKSISDAVVPQLDLATVCAVHEYISRAPAKLLAIQMEDVFGQVEQVNLPATSETQYPNWRRKLPLRLEDWRDDPRYGAIVSVLQKERACRGGARARVPQAARTRVIPRATYRWQFRRDFNLAQAAQWVPYLAALGVSHVYASSYLKARAGSSHGYDIIDHNAFNPEIGSEDDFVQFAESLRRHGMNQMLDLVPNHMGVLESDNAWWLDVLENGPASRYAGYFDIDWEPAARDLRGKVLIPVLGKQYGAALESGELKLAFDAARGEFSVLYYAHRFPIDPREYPRILGRSAEQLGPETLGDEFSVAAFRSLVTALGHLPPRDQVDAEKVTERARDKELRKAELAALAEHCPALREFIGANVAAINGCPGVAASYDALHELIEAQAYRLAYWRVASDDINYRRFFEINDLAALRMESEAVFEDTHRLVLRLVREGWIEALRIDHPDGLQDPKRYFERLQAAAARELSGEGAHHGHPPGKAIYLVIEKILAAHERLAEDWAVDGTTGYRFGVVVNGLFVDTGAEADIDRTYAHFIGQRHDYAALVRESKRLVMSSALASELNRLAALLHRIAASDRRHRDFTFNSLRRALQEIVANFPVYRTYITPSGPREEDMRYIDWAIGVARKRAYAGDTSVYEFVRAVLADCGSETEPVRARLCADLVARFQQFTAPVIAKATEDTVFYIYNRLTSLNEVGGDPRSFGLSLTAFHAASADRAKTWPHTMLTTSTHDNKRSEDVRARINVISEIPSSWRRALARWSRINRQRKLEVGGNAAPSRNDEYLLYQTLLGSWPLEPMDDVSLAAFRERIQRYMQKAAREAKVHTSWLNPDEEYERALASFIDALLRSVEGNLFLADFLPLQRYIAHFGLANSLAQTAIKLTSPGVPDIYQGNELWDFSLVDPDNRRSVDYARRAAMLDAIEAEFACSPSLWREKASRLLACIEDGRAKLYVTWRLLNLRKQWATLFEEGSYAPLLAAGARAEHVCAFARSHAEGIMVTVAPRLTARLCREARWPLGEGVWADTSIPLPEGVETVRNELTGEEISAQQAEARPALLVSEVLSVFPVAVLVAI